MQASLPRRNAALLLEYIRRLSCLEGAADEAIHSILNLSVCRELLRRVKLPQYNIVDGAIALLEKLRKITYLRVLTGAGVSTLYGIDITSRRGDFEPLQISINLGTPDVRSKRNSVFTLNCST